MSSENMFLRDSVKLTLEGAKAILAAAERKAKEIGVPMDIAIVDDGGNLLAFERMDGAKITSIDIAINKAFTAAGSRRGTHEYAELAAPGKPAFGIHVSNQGRFMIFGGGLPIVVRGEVVGGIGCSSGTAEEDRIVAQAGLDALKD
ncbi:MAG: GlcG/HbpS family heme-binding protein [Candidatus Bathyarchaeia archaeon]